MIATGSAAMTIEVGRSRGPSSILSLISLHRFPSMVASSFYLVVLSAFVAAVRSTELAAQTPSNEIRGFLRREYSLSKPYEAASLGMRLWTFGGSTMITNEMIRITPDTPSRMGFLWSTIPVTMRDWEMDVTFAIHGTTGSLFGDGMAIWYSENPAQAGPVFGSTDLFKGLAVFLDTYTNHPEAHNHAHPYISAMLNNGTLRYDHDRDGTHTQLGGHGKGCTAEFRNKRHPTRLLVRYVGNTLSVYTDIKNLGYWSLCFSVPGVTVPTNYYFGFSAATGDLSDNHDIVSVKVYEIDYDRVESENYDPLNIVPKADHFAAPRDHIDDNPPPSRLSSLRTGLFYILLLVAVAFVIVVSVLLFQKQQENRRKRFY